MYLFDDDGDGVLVVSVLERQRAHDVLAVELLKDQHDELVVDERLVQPHDVLLSHRLQHLVLAKTFVRPVRVVDRYLRHSLRLRAVLRLHVANQRESTSARQHSPQPSTSAVVPGFHVAGGRKGREFI